jgi:putative transposase
MNARQTSSIPQPTLPALHHLQLLSAHEAAGFCAARDTFEQELERVRRWYGSFVTDYIVMPEHIHLLLSEPERGKLSLVIQMLKQITSRKLRAPDQPRFWQVRYYDFPVWSEAKRIEKLRYIHRNPVKRGLAERPENWKWSSFAHYATGVEGPVEIESQWTARRRQRLGVVPTGQKPTLPHRTREGWGNPRFRTYERLGQPPLWGSVDRNQESQNSPLTLADNPLPCGCG